MTDRFDLPRVRHLRKRHEQALTDLAATQALNLADSPWVHTVRIDPTTKAIYLQTIIHWLLSGSMRFEDGMRISRLLIRFDADKRRLPIEQRDIGRYRTPGDLEDVLDPEDVVWTRDVPEDLLRFGCALEASGDAWALWRINDEASAAWFAQGTSWCTYAANIAQNYILTGPLYVIILNGKRYQYHWSSQQFVDARDRAFERFDILPERLIECILRTADAEPSRKEVGYCIRSTIEERLADELIGRGHDIARRPRGWHWVERGVTIWRGEPIPTSVTLPSGQNALYRPWMFASEDGVRMVTREDFVAGTAPEAFYDFLLLDRRTSPKDLPVNQESRNLIGTLQEMFTAGWKVDTKLNLPISGLVLDPSDWVDGHYMADLHSRAFMQGWTTIGRRHLFVWLRASEACLISRTMPEICVLDVTRRRMTIIRTREDLRSASTDMQMAVLGYHSPMMCSNEFNEHFGFRARPPRAIEWTMGILDSMLRPLRRPFGGAA